jgi:xylan 1,4-beta-xylosidase
MKRIIITFWVISSIALHQATAKSLSVDNENGAYTNLLYYEEFSDTYIFQAKDDFYLAGITMHTLPIAVAFHSKDLVNWTFLGYNIDKLELGIEFNIENDKEAHGQGIWAPCIHYNKGVLYFFTNVNGYGLQVFMSKNPKGSWKLEPFNAEIYDLSLLFDTYKKVYSVHKFNEIKLAELKPKLSDIVEEAEKVIMLAGNNMGEGHHMFLSLKTDGYEGLAPDNGEQYAADHRRTHPNCKVGTVLIWKIVDEYELFL